MIGTQRAALVQAVLEGISLPATKSELLAYAQTQEPDVTAELAGLPDERFSRLDDVGELLTLVPTGPEEDAPLPHPESGKPPGGDDYTTPHPKDTGRVRHDAPPANPPQKAIEQASRRQKRQKAAQG